MRISPMVRLALFMGVFLPPLPSAAQQIDGVESGARVRVTAPLLSNRPIVGVVDRLDPDTLFVRGDSISRYSIPFAHIRRLEISAGIPSDAGSGARVGMLLGALLAGGSMAMVCISTYDCPLGIAAGAAAAIGGLVGAAVGGATGGRKREQWRVLYSVVL